MCILRLEKVKLLFECGFCSSAASVRVRLLIKGGFYTRLYRIPRKEIIPNYRWHKVLILREREIELLLFSQTFKT